MENRSIAKVRKSLRCGKETIEIGHADLDSLATELEVVDHLVAPLAHLHATLRVSLLWSSVLVGRAEIGRVERSTEVIQGTILVLLLCQSLDSIDGMTKIYSHIVEVGAAGLH